MRIVWITENTNIQFASFRLRVWYFHQELQRQGVHSVIYRRGRIPKADVVIFQKAFSPRWLKLARQLKENGVRLIYSLSDVVPVGTVNFAGTVQMLALADDVLVCSRFLGEGFVQRYNPRWFVIEDPYDFLTPEPPTMQRGEQPSVFWHGFSKNHRLFVEPLRPMLNFQVHAVTEITQPRWELARLPNLMKLHEVGFAPLPLHNINIFGKSSNKVVGYMAAGLAVIASDIPSYRDVIVTGENGYLGRAPDDYNASYGTLRDPVHRQRVAQAGYETVRDRFSPRRLTERLLQVIDQ